MDARAVPRGEGDRLPLVRAGDGAGRLPRLHRPQPADEADNVFIATGDSGMGMTHGTIAGMLLTDLILGRPNAWEKLYDPRRDCRSR